MSENADYDIVREFKRRWDPRKVDRTVKCYPGDLNMLVDMVRQECRQPPTEQQIDDDIVRAVNNVLPSNGVFVGVWSLGEPMEGGESVRFTGIHVVANTPDDGLVLGLVNKAASIVASSNREGRN